MGKKVVLALALFGACGLAGAADKALTNKDVEKMVAAGLAPQTIVMTINNAKSGFDTSPDQLIRLSKVGVPQEVIAAMVAADSGAAAPMAAGTHAGGVAPGQIVMVDAGKRVNMQYTAGTLRSAVRALGFGGAATYVVLPGPQAKLRITSHRPTFELAIPSSARPDGYVTLARFEPRRNGTREVSIASGGGFSYSTGIHRDRIVETTITPVPGSAANGNTVYRITPVQDLAPGEYALVSSDNQAQRGAFGQAAGGGSYFDFGVD